MVSEKHDYLGLIFVLREYYRIHYFQQLMKSVVILIKHSAQGLGNDFARTFGNTVMFQGLSLLPEEYYIIKKYYFLSLPVSLVIFSIHFVLYFNDHIKKFIVTALVKVNHL